MTESTRLVEIGPLAELGEGVARLVSLDGREIGVVRCGTDVYAVRNICPHEGGPICRGEVVNRFISGEVGEIRLDPGLPVLTCPWHGWEFDLRTGTAICGERYRVRTYPTVVRDGRVFIRVPEHRQTEASRQGSEAREP